MSINTSNNPTNNKEDDFKLNLNFIDTDQEFITS